MALAVVPARGACSASASRQRGVGCALQAPRRASLAPGAWRRAAGAARRRAPVQPTQAILDFFRRSKPAAAASARSKQQEAVERLLSSVEGTNRGLSNSAEQQEAVLAAVAELAELGSSSTTTDAVQLSATWRLLWTTEKETLFILEKAGWFGTAAGEVYQVIDVEGGTLQNVITFPPEGAFVVDSSIQVASDQRTEFKFSSATLTLPAGRALRLPPFGQGWFDTVYSDERIRVARDSRGDTLVAARDGPPRRF